jgi:geranylgeranyl pyrophosphate synthase
VPLNLIEFVELLHAGSLVIDDIQDSSSLRRGKPTLHEVVGTPLAINTGNWMYFLALEKLQELPLPAEALSSVYAETISTIRQAHEGQALDLSAKVVEMDREAIYPTVRAICRLKTGGLTALAAKLEAALAGADFNRQKAFHSFGLHLGIALQMQNDLVELRSATGYGGRNDDLRQARVTWPWAWFSRFRSPKSFLSLQCMLLESNDDDSRLAVANKLFDSVSSVCETSVTRKLKSASACLAGGSISHLSQLEQLMVRIEAYYV